MLISDWRAARAAAALRPPRSPGVPPPRPRRAAREHDRGQGDGVEPAQVHALASDRADLMGGVADQHGAAGHHAARPARERTPKRLSMLLLPGSTSIPVRSRIAVDQPAGVRVRSGGIREADHPAAQLPGQRKGLHDALAIPGTAPRPGRSRWCRRSRPSGSCPGSPSPGWGCRAAGAHGGPDAVRGDDYGAPRTGLPAAGEAASTVTRPPSSCSPVTRTPRCRAPGRAPGRAVPGRPRCGPAGRDEYKREAVGHAGEGHLGECPAAGDGDAAPDRDAFGHEVRATPICSAPPAPGDGCRWPGSAARRRSAVPGPGRSRRCCSSRAAMNSPTGPPPITRTSATAPRLLSRISRLRNGARRRTVQPGGAAAWSSAAV